MPGLLPFPMWAFLEGTSMTESGTQVHVPGGYGTTGSTPGALLTRNTKRYLNHRAPATREGANARTRSSCRKQPGMP